MTRASLAMLAALIASGVAAQNANARTLKTIYDFCAEANCADGQFAGSPLLMSGQSFYGTTGRGGAHNEGIVFKMTLDQMTGQGNLQVLHDFCNQINCADGANPYTTLVRDKLGNLFGTTVHGGITCVSDYPYGCGTVFALIFNKTTRTYKHKVLHLFCEDQEGCADGSLPSGGLVADKDGNLYGVTTGGQTNGDYGTVFKLTPKNEARTSWAFKVIYKFCDKTCEGKGPIGGLVIDNAGNLYGTTYYGFASIAFGLMLNKSTGKYAFKVLHQFCQKQPDCTDGNMSNLGMTLDSAGNLFGTTLNGGAHGEGTVFKLTPNAAKTSWTHKVIHDFCAKAGCADGAGPYTNLLIDKNGNLFGASTTADGNATGGAIFQLKPNAKQTGYTFTSLARFCTENNCADGTFNGDSSGLTMDAAGNLFLPLLDRGAHQDSVNHYDAGSILELLND